MTDPQLCFTDVDTHCCVSLLTSSVHIFPVQFLYNLGHLSLFSLFPLKNGFLADTLPLIYKKVLLFGSKV